MEHFQEEFFYMYGAKSTLCGRALHKSVIIVIIIINKHCLSSVC